MQTGIRLKGIFNISDMARILEFNKKTSGEIWGKNVVSVYYYGQQNLSYSVSFWKEVEAGALHGDVSGGGPRLEL